MNKRIILASASKQRKMLMEALDLDFTVVPSEIDEKSIRDEDKEKQAEKIARAKAESVAQKEKGIIIAADTFAGLAGEILEKPTDLEDAKRMLSLISNSTMKVYTGFCYLDADSGINFSTCSVNEATARVITEDEIDAYVRAFPITTWAAGVSPAYAYGLGLFKNITGSPSSFSHGLPLDMLIEFLERSGVKVRPK